LGGRRGICNLSSILNAGVENEGTNGEGGKIHSWKMSEHMAQVKMQ